MSTAKQLSWSETEDSLAPDIFYLTTPTSQVNNAPDYKGTPTTLTQIHWIKESCPNREFDALFLTPAQKHFRENNGFTW